ncbi:unnamed protein product [Lampetra fluviatilis]
MSNERRAWVEAIVGLDTFSDSTRAAALAPCFPGTLRGRFGPRMDSGRKALPRQYERRVCRRAAVVVPSWCRG